MINPSWIREFFDYLIIDEDDYRNSWKGLREDAPKSAKIAFQKYLDEKEKAAKKGVRL